MMVPQHLIFFTESIASNHSPAVHCAWLLRLRMTSSSKATLWMTEQRIRTPKHDT
jgi:hypothetical protein